MENLERIHEEDPVCVEPQPAPHLSAVTSHGGCTNGTLQDSGQFACSTAIQKSSLSFLWLWSCHRAGGKEKLSVSMTPNFIQ